MITQSGVVEFKTVYCDENCIIAGLLRENLSEFFIEPILDVGSGTGEITASAFPDRNVIHVDILDYSDHPLPVSHSRIKSDFFQLTPAETAGAGTVLFCHVLQFLDDDVDRLNEAVRRLSPAFVVTVTNRNDEFMGNLLSWVKANFSAMNPEVEVPGFPDGYALDCEVALVGAVRCPDYSTLAEQVVYLTDSLPSLHERVRLEEHLKQKLPAPALNINQTIKVYRKHE